MSLSNSPQLVVNADDFGLHPDINRAIETAYHQGVLTSTSIVSCGTAFSDAVAIVGRCPNLGVGLHLTLVEEKPLTNPLKIPSLVNQDGAFWYNYRVLTLRLLTGRIRLIDVRQELEAQIQRALNAGLLLTHLDSHQHVHLLPGIWAVAVELAHQYNIRWIRVPTFDNLTSYTFSPIEPIFRLGMNSLSGLRTHQLNDLRCADYSPGLYLSGRLTKQNLITVLQNLSIGISELVVHPGISTSALQQMYHWDYHWSAEFEALVASEIRQLIAERQIELVSFAKL